MPFFKIHRLKDSQFQQFRWAPHTAGASQARPKDYAEAGAIKAESAYAAWTALRESGQALRVGDILEDESGGLRIYKYVGFEEAHWIVPEIKPGPGAAPIPPEEARVPAAESPKP